MKARSRGRRLTAAEAADKIGIDRGYLSGIENGHDNPGRETLRAIAVYYGASSDWLMTGQGSPVPGPRSPEEGELLWLFRESAEADRETIIKVARKGAGEIPDWVTRPDLILSADTARNGGNAERVPKRKSRAVKKS